MPSYQNRRSRKTMHHTFGDGNFGDFIDARESKSGAYIEVIGGRMDMPKGLAFAHTRLKELYGQTP